MAKRRYHQSVKDRLAESRGEERHLLRRDRRRGFNSDVGYEIEAASYDMIREDYSAPFNLPQNVVMKNYPKGRDYMDYDLDDTIRGVDDQMRDDSSGAKRHMDPDKY